MHVFVTYFCVLPDI